ncbi:flagellar hook assembly protein FlgD [Pistricoccus aurantiacus]|uniref:Basal-body rod modification protein FlgD n=1 Tax=Pistricoccus aurantiacus TaxID=1883414 RepID=A0A5B8SUH7_9GAMM|nr:flagellar hook assembly protein FlgD [Pistricoccus aurantiacus]QEA39687.1 flagellar hook assembly protein FlgD [Pistricoccus aurantiacus]
MASAIDSSVLSGINAGLPSQQASRANQGVGDLGDSFMTLLVTQLQNQDPLNPMQNAEMTSQLAQINTVSGIEDLNATLEGINSQIDAGQALQAASLVGQGVLVPGDRLLASVTEGGDAVTTPFGVELDQPADSLRVTISDGAGQVVSQYQTDPVKAGVSSFQWDGQLASGKTAGQGAYRVKIEALVDDKIVPSQTLNYAQVGGVIPQEQGGALLDLGAVYGQVGLSAIKQIL